MNPPQHHCTIIIASPLCRRLYSELEHRRERCGRLGGQNETRERREDTSRRDYLPRT
jgi:hypothetical protein